MSEITNKEKRWVIDYKKKVAKLRKSIESVVQTRNGPSATFGGRRGQKKQRARASALFSAARARRGEANTC